MVHRADVDEVDALVADQVRPVGVDPRAGEAVAVADRLGVLAASAREGDDLDVRVLLPRPDVLAGDPAEADDADAELFGRHSSLPLTPSLRVPGTRLRAGLPPPSAPGGLSRSAELGEERAPALGRGLIVHPGLEAERQVGADRGQAVVVGAQKHTG